MHAVHCMPVVRMDYKALSIHAFQGMQCQRANISIIVSERIKSRHFPGAMYYRCSTLGVQVQVQVEVV